MLRKNSGRLLVLSIFIIFLTCTLGGADAAQNIKRRKKNPPVLEDKKPPPKPPVPVDQGPPDYPSDCGDNIQNFSERCCKLVKKWWLDHIRPEHVPGIYGTFINSMKWDDSSQEGAGRCTAEVHLTWGMPKMRTKEGCLETPYCIWVQPLPIRGCRCGREHVWIVKLLKSLYRPI